MPKIEEKGRGLVNGPHTLDESEAKANIKKIIRIFPFSKPKFPVGALDSPCYKKEKF